MARERLPLHEDPGLQPERTYLAWRRTMLSFVVVGLVALRLLGAADVPPWPVLLLVAGIVIVVLLDQGARHRRSVAAIARGGLEPASVSVLVAGGGAAALAVVALAGLLR